MSRLVLRLESLSSDIESSGVDDPALTNGSAPANGPGSTNGSPLTDDTVANDTAGAVLDLVSHERAEQLASLSTWVAVALGSADACVVVDATGRVAGLSQTAARLLGAAADPAGRPLLDVIQVVDLETGSLLPDYAPRIPPLAVMGAGGILRSLTRVRHEDGSLHSLDTSSAALHDGAGGLIGSMTFLAAISG